MDQSSKEAPGVPPSDGCRPGAGLSQLPTDNAGGRRRSLVFGEVAELYDAIRPSYPTELIDEVLAATPDHDGARWLESGAGTGKCTALFTRHLEARGAELTCIEPDAAMAAVLRRHLADDNRTTVVVQPFESFAESEGPAADRALIYAAQSWHWLDAQRRTQLAASLLEPGGLLALIWNAGERQDPSIQAALDKAYAPIVARYDWWPRRDGTGAPVTHQPVDGRRGTEAAAELERSGLFDPVRVAEHHWERRYTTKEWLELLSTHSDHRMLPTDERTAVLERVGGVIDDAGGSLLVQYAAFAVTGKRSR